MKKRILSLALSLSLAVSLFAPAFAAEAEPVIPTAPEWIRAEDYLIIPDDEVYLPENWVEIEDLREQARNGATSLIGANGKKLDTWNQTGSIGHLCELGWIWLKCAENGGFNDSEAGQNAIFASGRAFELAKSARSKSLGGKPDELYKWISVQHLRALLLNNATYFISNRMYSVTWIMTHEAKELGLTLKDIYDMPHMELVTPEHRYMVAESVIDTYLESSQPIPPSSEGYIQIFLDDNYVKLDVPAVTVNNRTMIPIRAVAEAMGAEVGWEESTRQVTLTRAGTTIVMTVDSPTATVNGETITMDVAPYISGGRTLLPVRYVAEFFSQKVEWEGSTCRVFITEDRSVVKDSNLEAWAMPMGSMLSWMNSDSDPTIFGSRIRTAEAAEERRDDLSSGWGVSNREDLVNTVIRMTLYGHDASFREMAADVKQRSETERKAISEASSAWPYFMWEYTEQLDEKWGDRGIMAWDLFRMSNLIQWGYVAGYVTYEEALALLEPAATLLCANFSSWDEAYENYLDGYTWWARTNAEEWAQERLFAGKFKTHGEQIQAFETQEGWQDWMRQPRGTYYYQMKTNPDYAHLFDDTLFETGVIGVPEE